MKTIWKIFAAVVLLAWLAMNVEEVSWRSWLNGFVLGGLLLEWLVGGKADD